MARHLQHIFTLLFLLAASCLLVHDSPLWAAGSAGTSKEQKGGRQVKDVRVGMLVEPGFTELLPNKRRAGYGYEYLQEVAFRSGWKLHYIDARRVALVSLFEEGAIDVLMGMTKTKEREQTMLYSSIPQGNRNYFIYTHPYGSGRIKRGDVQTVNGARIGVEGKSVFRQILEDWAQTNGVEPVIVECDEDELGEELAAGRLDGVVDHDMRLNNQEIPLFPLGSTDFYFTVNPRRPDLLEDIEQAQEKLLEMQPFYAESLKQKFFTATVNQQGLAPEELNWSRARGRIRIGYLDDFAPVSANVRGKIEGQYALIEQMLKGNFGLEVESIPYTSETAMLDALKEQKVDAIFPYIFNFMLAEKDDIILSSAAIKVPGVVIQRSGFTGPVQTVAVLKSGSLMKLSSLIAYPEASFFEGSSLKACLKAVNSRKADLLQISNYRLSRVAKDFYAFPDLEMKPGQNNFDLCFAVGRDKPILMEILNKAITAMSSGEGNSFLFSAMSYGYGFSFSEFVHDHAVPLMLGVTLVALLTTVFFRRRLTKEQERKRILIQTNAELEATKEALEVSTEAAKQANRAKSMFLSKMSHDIRTPLNAIIGFSNLLLSRDSGREEVKDQVGKILLSADHLLGLVNDVLDVSKIESGAMTLTPTDFRLSGLLASVEEIIRPLATAKQQEFTVELDKDGVFFADKGRLSQVLMNLLSNAVKYTGKEGHISFRVSNEPSPVPERRNVTFVVADNGRGMSEEYMKTLFTPFSREHRPEESAEVGTGLGLPIVQNLASLMGGTVSVESKIRQGTTFTILLPLPVSTSEAVEDVGRTDGNAGGTGRGQTGKYLSGREKPLAGLRILVAEDNELNTEILTAYLTINGAALTVAENGKVLLDIFSQSSEESFDVILMDIQMPVMDGLAATRTLRQLDRPDAKSIPVIAMSANAFSDDVAASLDAGMNAHISKPIELSALIRALEATKVRRDRDEAC
ncbi:MAG: response regulator [Treponema sp.]|nr:response regulator [Treponema sp.]